MNQATFYHWRWELKRRDLATPAFLLIRELLDVLRQTRHENEQLQPRLDLLLRRRYGLRREPFGPNQPLLSPRPLDAPEDDRCPDGWAWALSSGSP